jgi:hypothetical protein
MKYLVSIPLAGSVRIEVEAESEEQAREAAWEQYSENGPDDFDVEWEAFERITSGNVESFAKIADYIEANL